jgi:hypothetical protein
MGVIGRWGARVCIHGVQRPLPGIDPAWFGTATTGSMVRGRLKQVDVARGFRPDVQRVCMLSETARGAR